ncbi:MAG: hypothetical protein ACJ746_07665 [Bryobacteraceae bacterium]
MLYTPQLGCCASVRAASLLLLVLSGASNGFGQTNPELARPACSCPDGRQFSIGSSLFGKNSARVVITGFHRDLALPGPPSCKDLTVVGQTVRLEVLDGHPFLRRENRKSGTISDICETKIQFAEPKKSYDFFKDDGTAVTLSDIDAAQPLPGKDDSTALATDEHPGDRRQDDLTGKDLIRMMPSQEQGEDPGSAGFDADDLKEGAYFILRRQVKAAPAVDDSIGANVALPPNPQHELTVWAGSLGRIEKRAGFRDGPLWVVEVLPHSAPLPFSSYLRSLPSTFRKHHPTQKKFVLSGDDIVEINHFLDTYSLEWTRFGDDSDDARTRESAGTTNLPEIYSAPGPALDENLGKAREAGVEKDIRKAAMRLTFRLKNLQPAAMPGELVLDEDSGVGSAAPHYFHQQCFVTGYPGPTAAGPALFRVTDADLAIFQPEESPQVPKDYYAVDVRLRLKSDAGRSMPVVCRFPSAAIEETLLDSTERILSSVFSIAPSVR